MAEILAETVDDIVIDAAKEIVAEGLLQVNAAVITDIAFFAFIFGVTAAIFISTQSWLIHDFFNRFGHGVPIAAWGIELGANIANIFLSVAISCYAWSFRNPSAGDASNWYSGVIGYFLGILAMNFIWSTLLWRYHQYKVTLWMAMFIGFLTFISMGVEVTLFGVRHAFVSLVMIIPFLLSGCLVAFNVYLVWRNYSGNALCEVRLNPQDERALINKGQQLPPPSNGNTQSRYGQPVRG